MTVLHVIPSVGPTRGGTSVALKALARGTARAGMDVHVVTTDDDGTANLSVPFGVPLREDGVVYWYFPRQTAFYTFSWPMTKWLTKNMNRYDVVHIHALFSYSSTIAAILAQQHGIPYIVLPHGMLNRWGIRNRRPVLKWLSFAIFERQLLAKASAIQYTGEQEQKEAEVLGRHPRPAIIPYLIEPTPPRDAVAGLFRKKYHQIGKRQIVLFLSRLDPKKGLDLLFPAFARAKAQNPEMVLVAAGDGDAEYKRVLKSRTHALGIGADVIWPGHLSDSEKWSAYADADLFVLPSHSENFGLAIVEAMSMGTPVIITDRVGIHNEVAKARAGFVIECDVDRLSQAMGTLIRNAALRAEMGHNGRELVQSVFLQDSVVDRLLTLYRDVGHHRN